MRVGCFICQDAYGEHPKDVTKHPLLTVYGSFKWGLNNY